MSEHQLGSERWEEVTQIVLDSLDRILPEVRDFQHTILLLVIKNWLLTGGGKSRGKDD